MAINKCGSLSEEDLETIYEVTYKYGWLLSEKRREGWLNDRANMEMFRIEEAVEKWMPFGLEGMLDTYEEWLSVHEEEGWIEQFDEYGLEDINSVLEMWDISIDEDMLYEEVARSFGSDRDFLIEVEDADFSIETHAENVVDYLIGKEDNILIQEKMQAEVDYIGHEEYFNEHYDIYTIIDWLIDEQGWTAKEHLKDVYHDTKDLLTTFGANIDLNVILKQAYRDYLDHFDGLEDEIIGIAIMKDKIENAMDSDLEEQIITFQEGLTTAHHHGTMADHLLEVEVGTGITILDNMSSDINTALWNKDLEGALGRKLYEE